MSREINIDNIVAIKACFPIIVGGNCLRELVEECGLQSTAPVEDQKLVLFMWQFVYF